MNAGWFMISHSLSYLRMSLSLFFPTLTHTYSLTPLSVSFSLLLLVPSLSFPTLTHTYSLTPLYVSLSLSSLIPVLSFPTLTHTYSPLCLSLPLITRTQPLIPYTDTYLLPYSPLCLSLFLSSLVPSLSFPTLTHTYSLTPLYVSLSSSHHLYPASPSLHWHTLTPCHCPALQAKGQGMCALQVTFLEGMMLASHSSSPTVSFVAFTHTTSLIRIPPPQVALHCRTQNRPISRFLVSTQETKNKFSKKIKDLGMVLSYSSSHKSKVTRRNVITQPRSHPIQKMRWDGTEAG